MHVFEEVHIDGRDEPAYAEFAGMCAELTVKADADGLDYARIAVGAAFFEKESAFDTGDRGPGGGGDARRMPALA
ncbi:MAG TPA: hypothetical protein VL918_06705 [Sphingobium sp.]|nr:hypothetical protein [Sphingobium sp.]